MPVRHQSAALALPVVIAMDAIATAAVAAAVIILNVVSLSLSSCCALRGLQIEPSNVVPMPQRGAGVVARRQTLVEFRRRASHHVTFTHAW